MPSFRKLKDFYETGGAPVILPGSFSIGNTTSDAEFDDITSPSGVLTVFNPLVVSGAISNSGSISVGSTSGTNTLLGVTNINTLNCTTISSSSINATSTSTFTTVHILDMYGSTTTNYINVHDIINSDNTIQTSDSVVAGSVLAAPTCQASSVVDTPNVQCNTLASSASWGVSDYIQLNSPMFNNCLSPSYIMVSVNNTSTSGSHQTITLNPGTQLPNIIFLDVPVDFTASRYVDIILDQYNADLSNLVCRPSGSGHALNAWPFSIFLNTRSSVAYNCRVTIATKDGVAVRCLYNGNGSDDSVGYMAFTSSALQRSAKGYLVYCGQALSSSITNSVNRSNSNLTNSRIATVLSTGTSTDPGDYPLFII